MALGYAGVPAADSRPPIWSGWAWVRRMASISSGPTPSRARLAISSPPTPLLRRCRYPPAPYSRDRGSDRRQSQWSPARLILNAAADVPPPPVRYPRVRTAALTSDHHSRQSPSGRQRSTYKREQVTWRPHARCAGLRNRAVMG